MPGARTNRTTGESIFPAAQFDPIPHREVPPLPAIQSQETREHIPGVPPNRTRREHIPRVPPNRTRRESIFPERDPITHLDAGDEEEHHEVPPREHAHRLAGGEVVGHHVPPVLRFVIPGPRVPFDQQ
eukprot:2234885-Pyramimonas_sp.AAC.1